jgi:CHAT domain-containing protein
VPIFLATQPHEQVHSKLWKRILGYTSLVMPNRTLSRDDHFTLLDIMDRDIPCAEFAFLSACHTAVGGKKTPDEVIHLAAGFQFSGLKSVVGTL